MSIEFCSKAGNCRRKEMGKPVKVEIITRETIKPSTPTPEHKRYLKLSLLDKMTLGMSTPIILFYHVEGKDRSPMKIVSQQIRSSLSEALTIFYPLAGTVKDNSVIDCNDSGVDYVEARFSCIMLDLLRQPDMDLLEKLLPNTLNAMEVCANTMVQVNFFACGGLAIGANITHKVGDATSFGNFMIAWATKSFAAVKPSAAPLEVLVPHFVSDSLLPSLKNSLPLPPALTPPPELLEITKTKMGRIVFDASKISMLKAKAASEMVQHPSRVEVVTALIWKCLIAVARSKSGGSARQSVVTHTVNLRKRLIPPLPQNYVGNLSGEMLAQLKLSNDQLELQGLVARLRKGLEETSKRAAQGNQGNNILSSILEFGKQFADLHRRGDADVYSFSSLCGFPWYGVDFGWGKPAWVVATNLVLKNYVLLIDAKDGKGIEAWLSLREEDMALFQENQELLFYASMNPGVYDNKNVPAIQSFL